MERQGSSWPGHGTADRPAMARASPVTTGAPRCRCPMRRRRRVRRRDRDLLPAVRAQERAGLVPGGHVARCSRSAGRAPVRLDHPPHREDEDELRGTRGAAVGATNPRGGGRDRTHSDDGAVAAGRAHPIAGFWPEGRRRRVHGRPGAGPAARVPAPCVPPPRARRARGLGCHGDALAGRAGGALGAHGRPGRAPGAPNPDRAGRRTLGSRPRT